MKFIKKRCQCDLGYTGVECGSLINLCDADNPCPNSDFNECLPFLVILVLRVNYVTKSKCFVKISPNS